MVSLFSTCVMTNCVLFALLMIKFFIAVSLMEIESVC